jgi:succinoglycan biosynthesis transport protein ExoP
VDLRHLIAIARKWYPLLVASVVVAAGAAFVVSSMLPKTYEAKATLIVGQALSAANPDYTQLLVSQRLSATYARVAMTRPILESVIAKLDLAESTDELARRARAEAAPDSTLLTIAVDDADPARAAAIANELADKLIAVSPTIQGLQTEVQKSTNASLVATQQQIDETQAEVARLANLAGPAPADVTRLDTLQARLITLRSTYAALLSFSSGSVSNLLSVIEPAVAPIVPVSPKLLLNTLVAALVGLLIAVGVVSVIQYLDDAVKDAEGVELLTGLATLGTIPKMRGDTKQREIYRLVTVLNPLSPAAEAYRVLRTNIEFASLEEPLRTLLVTSTAPSEGKTVTAANLAVVFAQGGRQVILVDADLRKPGIHRIFDLPNEQGLTAMLRDEALALDAVAHGTEVSGLRVLTTGALPANPAELLGSHRMQAVLGQLMANADLVVLDSPPLQVVTDPAILSSYVDRTVLVIEAGRSRRRAVSTGQEVLARAGANVPGVVLNRVPSRSHASYGGYYGEPQRDEPEASPTGAAW